MRGYLILAQNSGKNDYIRAAYALALSIKATQKIKNVSVIVENKEKVPQQYRSAFHKIVEIPWGDGAKESTWKIDNKWKYFYASPYEETVVLDADMLMLSDISHYWDFYQKYSLCFTSKTISYDGTEITSDYYRKIFTENRLPNCYTGLFYFKKDKVASDFFKLVDYVFKNFDDVKTKILKNSTYIPLSGDVAYAAAIKIFDDHKNICCSANPNSFVHMKMKLFECSKFYKSEVWHTNLQNYMTPSGKVYVSNYLQKQLFHYVDLNWLTNDKIEILENL